MVTGMRIHCFWLTTLAFFALWNLACDDSVNTEHDETDEDFNISVDGSIQMSRMSDNESYQLCKDIADGLNNVIDEDVQCLRVSIAAGQAAGSSSEEVCNDTFLSCIGSTAEDYQKCDRYEETTDKYKDCDAKVEVMGACMKKTITALQDEYNSLSCASENMKDPSEFESCDTCQELENQCPGVTTNFDRRF